MLTEFFLKEKILKSFPDSKIIIKDISGGCGASFEVYIVSNLFSKKPILQRHRLVNECIKEELKDIHALTLKTYTQEESLNKPIPSES